MRKADPAFDVPHLVVELRVHVQHRVGGVARALAQQRRRARRVLRAPADADFVVPRDAQDLGEGQIHRDGVRVEIVESDRLDSTHRFQRAPLPDPTMPARQRPATTAYAVGRSPARHDSAMS